MYLEITLVLQLLDKRITDLASFEEEWEGQLSEVVSHIGGRCVFSGGR